jgi:hypothetical protein
MKSDLGNVVTLLFLLFVGVSEGDKFGQNMKKSCALVSNAGELRGSHKGADVNAHDLVARINFAPIKGFESDVGARTDLVFTGYPAIVGIPGKPSRRAAKLTLLTLPPNISKT